MEIKYSKARNRSISKAPVSGAKHVLWDQLSVQITKFREYLNLVDDEQALIKTCGHICNQLKDELELRPIKSA